ncbi:Dos2-interacting transcription regulator of RNA-Pol-II-domain-containing protein [Amylocarpus encephaloides]|uniref:MMS19 nucleotide excision repair protein n=1 Tax=Amylocarpus encephaloides TaxID=45428 RepID=A0A9P8C6A4_9HELO|nr:Dos2-interacting transcription regulator of RNA-Pol-II-domain-containing protein [Amylocarpus encephaloides]
MAETMISHWMGAPLLAEGQAITEEAVVTDIAGSIELGSLQFPDLITELQPYIGADQEDLVIVSRGMALLPRVLREMDMSLGVRQDIHFLVDYLRLRLNNFEGISNFHYGLDHNVDCLFILIELMRFTPGDAATVAQAIFSLARGTVNTFANLSPSTRLKFYMVLSTLVGKYARQLQRDLGANFFVTGLVELSEFEKGAHCLREVLWLDAKLAREWELEPEALTKLWDCFVRYYPINLGAKTDSQVGPEELKEALRQCFTANNLFAKEAFDTLLSKIDEDQAANTKKDVLATIDYCVNAYSVPIIFESATKIWDTIKFEIWNGENDEFIADSLRILNSIFSSLSRSNWPWDTPSQFSKLVESIAEEIFERLSDMQQYAGGSARMLLAIGSSSSLALRLVVKRIFPGIISMAQDDRAKISKKSLMGVFNAVLQARIDLAREKNSEQDPASLDLSPETNAQDELKLTQDMLHFREPLIDIFFGAISELKANPNTDPSLSAVVIRGLVLLVRIPSLFLTEKGMILETLNEVALSQSSSGQLQASTLSAIRELSIFDEQGFKEITLPNFIKQLPEAIELSSEAAIRQALDNAMHLLENLVNIGSTTSANHDELQASLVQKFDAARKHKGQLQYLNILIATARRGLQLFDAALEKGPCDARIRNPLDGTNGSYSHIVLPYVHRIVGVVQRASEEGDSVFYIGIQNSADASQPFDDFTIDMLGQMMTIAMLSDFYEVEHSDEPNGGEVQQVYKKFDNILVAHDKSRPEGSPSAVLTLFCTGEDLDRVVDSVPSQFDFETWPSDRALVNFLAVSLLAGFDPKSEEHPSGLDVGKLAAALIRGSVNPDLNCSRLARVAMLLMLQLLVNKFGAGSERYSESQATIMDLMLSLSDNPPSSAEAVENVYRTLAYFSDASLSAYLGDSAFRLIEHMADGLVKPFGDKAAQSFRILLAPSSVLTKKNFCFVRPLRKGRLFELSVRKLISMWRQAGNPEHKQNCLIALAGILANMDSRLLHENIELLFPAALEGTNITNDEWAKATFLQFIYHMIPLAPRTIESHLDSVINRMTDRTHNIHDSPSDSSARCRVMALEVLSRLVKFVDSEKLNQRKFRLIAEIDIALDDCSRDVRQKAAACKISWFNLKEAAKEE